MAIDFSRIQIPFLADDEIRRRADKFRQANWGDKIPVNVELIAERNLRLFIIPIPDLRYQAHTEAYLSGDLKELAYDPSLPDVRVRFSVAHEIGHYVLHRDVITKLRVGSREEWKEVQRDLPDALWGRAEYQAREFAGRLLVPLESLVEAIESLRPSIDQAKKELPDLELPVLKEFVATRVARRFDISYDVIMRRMDAEGISQALL